MDDLAFATYLAARFPQPTANSYLAYCRRIESHLGIDLARADLSEGALATMATTLQSAGNPMPRTSARNCMVAVRHYAAFRGGDSIRTTTTAEPAARPIAAARPAHVRDASIRELLTLYGQVIDELRDREVVRTANSPLGDYAERLFARAFEWELEGNSAAGHDAIGDGVRYQIKARRISARNPSRQLSAIRRLPDKTFDLVAAVLFDEGFSVLRAALIPHAVVEQRAKRREHTNSWRFVLDDSVWLLPGVQDVTAALIEAQRDF